MEVENCQFPVDYLSEHAWSQSNPEKSWCFKALKVWIPNPRKYTFQCQNAMHSIATHDMANPKRHPLDIFPIYHLVHLPILKITLYLGKSKKCLFSEFSEIKIWRGLLRQTSRKNVNVNFQGMQIDSINTQKILKCLAFVDQKLKWWPPLLSRSDSRPPSLQRGWVPYQRFWNKWSKCFCPCFVSPFLILLSC